MTKQEKLLQLDKLIEVIGSQVRETIEADHMSEISVYEMFVTCLEAMIIHEVITGQNLLKDKAKVIPIKGDGK